MKKVAKTVNRVAKKIQFIPAGQLPARWLSEFCVLPGCLEYTHALLAVSSSAPPWYTGPVCSAP
jgi:hypothetical protein